MAGVVTKNAFGFLTVYASINPGSNDESDGNGDGNMSPISK